MIELSTVQCYLEIKGSFRQVSSSTKYEFGVLEAFSRFPKSFAKLADIEG